MDLYNNTYKNYNNNYNNNKQISLIEQYKQKLKERDSPYYKDTTFIDQFSHNNSNQNQLINPISNNNIQRNITPIPYNQKNNNIIKNRPLSQKQYESSIEDYGNSYKGTGIIPREKGNNEDKKNQNMVLRDIWFKEIEEKKIRKEKEKQRQKELDLLEEQRILRDIEEEKMKYNYEKQKKEQMEKNVRNDNSKIIEENKKNNNLNQNININDNNNNLKNAINNYNNIDLNNILNYNKNNIQNNYQNNYNNNQKNINQQYYNSINANNYQNNQKIYRPYMRTYRSPPPSNILKVNDFEFSPNPKQLDDSKNPQIAKLKNEVNKQYMEISSLFKTLNKNVIEANQRKNYAEKEFNYIKNEINKEKMYQYSKNAKLKKNIQNIPPNYNNKNINYIDVDPFYQDKNYINNNINIDKRFEISNLAKAGQNSIRLTSQSEFVPINNNFNINNHMMNREISNININGDPGDNIAVSSTGGTNLGGDSIAIFQQNDGGDINLDDISGN